MVTRVKLVLPELYRLISRVLNARLTIICLRRGILHPAQRAAISDGDFYQAVDSACNVLEDARENSPNSLAFILCDQSKAFDLVHAHALRRAMMRIRLPPLFMELVISAISRASARVRSHAGLSGSVPLLRSLRQGDPLASILYCIYIDPLHWALDGAGGYVMQNGTKVASLAFMDDTNVMANDFEQLRVLHRLVIGFSLVNDARINASKTHLFLADHRGSEETRHLFSEAGEVIRPEDPETTERYLGVWINLQGNWEKMDRILKRTFWRIFYLIKNLRMPCRAASLLVDVFLLPAVQRSLRLVRYAEEGPPRDTLIDLQKALNALMAELNGMPLPRAWRGSITPLLLGYKDLTEHAVTLSVERLHLSLNFNPANFLVAASTHDRLAAYLLGDVRGSGRGGSGAPLLEKALGRLEEEVGWGSGPPTPSSDNNSTARRLGVAHRRGLTFKFNPRHLGSNFMMVERAPQVEVARAVSDEEGTLPHPTLALLSQLRHGMAGTVGVEMTFEMDPLTMEWTKGLIDAPSDMEPQHLVVFTDGSAKRGEDSGSAAVWYLPGQDKPCMEVLARLPPSAQSYPAECVGCLLALYFSPLNWPLTIVCDCQAALFTASKPSYHVSWRKRIMSSARATLECVRRVGEARTATTHWRKVEAHTGLDDFDAKGNARADMLAKQARGGRRFSYGPRFWKLGAEAALLCKWANDPDTTRQWDRVRLSQVTGDVRAALDRLEAEAGAFSAAKAKTMGQALRYNQAEVLASVSHLKRRSASGLHALIAMALASFLPFRNRDSYQASAHPTLPRCNWCHTGLKQESPHLYACPAVAQQAWEGFRELGRLVAADGSVCRGATGDRIGSRALDWWEVKSEKGCHRDTLISLTLHLTGRRGFESEAEVVGDLSGDALSKVPLALGRLASTWARDWSRGAGSRLPGEGCLIRSWTAWLNQQRQLAELLPTAPLAPHNCGPHPETLRSLVDLASPFWAVVVDGPAWLAPPSNMVWYRSETGPLEPCWWAEALPLEGQGLHLLDWAPLASRADMETRADWWASAVMGSQDTLIAAVIPQHDWAVEMLVEKGLRDVLLSVTVSVDLWGTGLADTLWVPSWRRRVNAKLVLLGARPSAVMGRGGGILRSLKVALEAPVGEGASLGPYPWDSPEKALPPANWWWGPTEGSFPRGHPVGQPTPKVHRRCGPGDLCRRLCSASHIVSVDCYWGNLGVPPLEVTAARSDGGVEPLALKDPPAWRSFSWELLQKLCAEVKAEAARPRALRHLFRRNGSRRDTGAQRRSGATGAT